jgi:hypothetical protein
VSGAGDPAHHSDLQPKTPARRAARNSTVTARMKRGPQRISRVAEGPVTALTENSNRYIARRAVVVRRSDHRSDTRNGSVDRFHARYNRYVFKQHRSVCGSQITITFSVNGEPSNNDLTSNDPTEPTRSGLTLAQIRELKHLHMQAMRNIKVVRMQAFILIKETAPWYWMNRYTKTS